MSAYRPSSGTEGISFYARWCDRCARDAHMNSGKDWDACEPHEICKIIGDTLAYDVTDPKYPKAWVYKDGVPTCTEFVEFVPDAEPQRITDQERAAQCALPL